MKFYQFPPYGVNGSAVSVCLERITHYYRINYNGNSGTVLVLDTGKEVSTSMREGDVRKLLEE
ncbi:hypothetical protein BIY29_10255 [Brenneria alni]|uniref:Uncharacterized protein n=1 Tax=Brenneria alni TaxID=71656 RepID=A0A421DNP7_9GAMM|nr:hypothetical protein [Brenneria alni]RLM23673.1 hypothetical protein BIY29_10255 [Brenneria alni]